MDKYGSQTIGNDYYIGRTLLIVGRRVGITNYSTFVCVIGYFDNTGAEERTS